MEETKGAIDKEETIEYYKNMNPADRKIVEASFLTVAETEGSADRVEEIKVFAKELGFKKIGIAFCKGLREYGEKIDKELSNDFEVVSVCCNISEISKDDIGVTPIEDASELACNPIGQATVLNANNVDYTIKCGFCLGHDLIFSKNIESPTTTLLVKDRKFHHELIEKYK